MQVETIVRHLRQIPRILQIIKLALLHDLGAVHRRPQGSPRLPPRPHRLQPDGHLVLLLRKPALPHFLAPFKSFPVRKDPVLGLLPGALATDPIVVERYVPHQRPAHVNPLLHAELVLSHFDGALVLGMGIRSGEELFFINTVRSVGLAGVLYHGHPPVKPLGTIFNTPDALEFPPPDVAAPHSLESSSQPPFLSPPPVALVVEIIKFHPRPIPAEAPLSQMHGLIELDLP
mmetsp:Transcript_9040/g.26345  ORF Transcript_9040/g.26345 Transcript_9040/m.26345 type:complete len:231 (+) Transcript_9040:1297-1989(+)